MLWWAVAGGVALGVAYTLSPLTVLCLAALFALTRWAGRDLTGRERQWFFALMTIAIVSRVVIVGGLFLSADSSKPYAAFFGDELIFKSRPIWLRNWGLGVPISTADTVAAFDETGMSGHMYVLAYLQALVGDAPYGVHLFNILAYVSGTVLLFRLVRPAFGRYAALAGLGVLLFLPSLFSWSISALKEPVYTLLASVELIGAVAVARSSQWWRKGMAIATVVVMAVALEGLRKGTLLVVAVGTGLGILAGVASARPRLLLAALAIVPIGLAATLSVPAIQQRIRATVTNAVRYHAGHVVTPGISFRNIDDRYYSDWGAIQRMPDRELAQFVARAVASYVVEPLPSRVESRALWAYLPEQLVWLLLISLVPFGIVRGLRRDAMLTCILVAHGCAAIMLVALNSGNVGTLIRHRGLALPYLVWLSALGALAIVAWLSPAPGFTTKGTPVYGNR